jgi:hypothetical protein
MGKNVEISLTNSYSFNSLPTIFQKERKKRGGINMEGLCGIDYPGYADLRSKDGQQLG